MPVETTVALGKGQRKGRYDVSPAAILAAARVSALQAGLGEEGARVLQAILHTEGGLEGAVGDLDGGGSFGPTQLYWGGQLGNLASQKGMTKRDAAEWVQANPTEAVDWAVNGYLGQAIRAGMRQGLAGPDLATFAQKTGQVSVHPERAGQAYQENFPDARRSALPVSRLAELVRPVVAAAEPVVQAVAQQFAPAVAEAAELEQAQPIGTGGASVDPQARGAAATDPSASAVAALEARKNVMVGQPKLKWKKPGGVSVDQQPMTTEGGVFGLGGTKVPDKTYTPYRDTTYADGRIVTERQAADGHWEEVTTARDDGLAKKFADDEANLARATKTDTGTAPLLRTAADGTVYQVDPRTGVATKVEGIEPRKAPPPTIHTAADGSVYQIDPTTGAATPVTGIPPKAPPKPSVVSGVNDVDEFITVMDPDGSIRSVPNPSYNPVKARSAEGRAAAADNRAQATLGSSIESQQAQAALARAQAQKILHDQIPQQQQLIQNHLGTIQQLQTMVASGQLTPQQADQYVTQSQQSLEAGLRGASPYQEQQAQQSWQENQQRIGSGMLNQRLSSGSSLAANLMQGAGTLAQSAMSMPGHRITYDPTALAMALTDRLGGGPEMSKLAQAMLSGANPMPSGLGAGTPAGMAQSGGMPIPQGLPAGLGSGPIAAGGPTGAAPGLNGPPPGALPPPPAPPMPGDPNYDPRLLVGGVPPPLGLPGMPA